MNAILTYPWIVKQHMLKSTTILDVGCGNGTFIQKLELPKTIEVIGVDLFGPYLQNAKATNAYNEVLKGDVRELSFPTASFDCVHASQVIEHLTQSEATSFIENCEKIASNVIIFGTPNGEYDQDEYDGNILQQHHSAWEVKDFTQRGYKVYGQALKVIYGDGGLLYKPWAANPVVKKILFLISYLCNPVVYFFPQFAAQLIAVKYKK